MAATTIRDLLVRLGVEADTKSLDTFEAGLKNVAAGLSAVSAAAIGAVGALFGITAATASAGDEAAKTAKQIGLTTDAYQELLFAAERSGASQEQLAVGLKTIQRLAFDAANGNAEAAKTFDQLGISVTDANGNLKSGEQLLLEAADAISKLDSEAEKIALAQKLFGEGGAALLPLLDSGAKGIDELRRRARELGFIMDEEATRASEQFADSLLDAQLVLEGLRNIIGTAFLPVFTQLLDWFVMGAQFIQPIVSGFLEFIDKTIGLEAVIAGLVAIFVAFGTAAAALGALLTTGAVAAAITSIISFFTAFAAIIGTTLAPAIAIFVAGVAALAAQLAVLAAGIASIIAFFVGWALIIEDFIVFMRDGKSVIGEFVNEFAGTEGPLGAYADALLKLKELTFSVLELLSALGELALAVLVPAFEAAWTALQPVVNLLGMLLGLVGDLIALGLEAWFDGAVQQMDNTIAAIEFVTDAVRQLVDLLNGAAQIAGTLGLVDTSGLAGAGGNTSNTTNNVNVTTNAPITTTAGADETAAAVGGAGGDAAAQALAALSGSEA